MRVCKGARSQRRRDLPHRAMPVAGARLPKQPGARIPGAVLPVEHPAPIRLLLQQDPDRQTERAGKMRAAVSEEITRSSSVMTAAVSLKSSSWLPR